MKSENNIKKFFGKASVDTNPAKDKKVLNKIIAAQTKTSIWRLIMESPVTKLAAAAVFIAGVFILFVYSSNGRDSLQKNESYVVTPNHNNEQLPIANNILEEDLLLANELYEKNDISGLSELLNNEFKKVRFQAAEFLGQIGDETVITQLQMLADKWDDLEEENVFKNAILNINNRIDESKTNNETLTATDILNETSNNTIENNTPEQEIDLNRLLSSRIPYIFDDQDDEESREPENILFGTVLDERGNPVSGAQVFASYAESGITNSEGNFELQVPRTDGGGSIGPADFPIYVWAFKKDDPYKVAWTLIRDTELEHGQQIEQTHQGVEFTIVDEEELLEKIPGIPGELSYNKNHNRIVKDIVLIMGPSGIITGQIRNSNGQPAAGAIVQAEEFYMKLGENKLFINGFDPDWKPCPECVADDQGYYTLTNIPDCWSEAHLTLKEAQGYTKTYQMVTNNGESTTWNIQLSEIDLNLQREFFPEQITEYEEKENEHFANVIADGYPLRGMKNSISEVVPNYLQKNLILYYSFYDCMILNKPEVVTDMSGNKHDGQEKELKYEWDDILNGTPLFDGSNDYISVPGIKLEAFTFSAWVKPTTEGLNNRRIFLLDNGQRFFALQGNSPDGVGFCVDKGEELNEEDWRLNKDFWTHITVTFDGHVSKIYKNGLLTEQGNLNANAITGTLYIGGNESYNGGFWKGNIDEIGLFNRVLTDEEVQQLFLLTGTYIEQ
ncbi:MAG: hypothetical protein JXA96_04380 [Sedimentisphaerales bacterium]|nr:hypothetical protein [Sedimentisphaerales bacterium]